MISSAAARCLLLAVCLMGGLCAWGQELKRNLVVLDPDVVPIARTISLRYENDVFAKTDRYFSQGVHLQAALPALGRLDFGNMFSPAPGAPARYAIGAHLEAYTPSTIRSDSILRGDRPYAGLFYLTLAGAQRGVGKAWETSGMLSLGIIGPAALGEEVQAGIHRATGDFIPLGWRHQIRNDVLLNGRLLCRYHITDLRWLSLTADAQGDVGTFFDRATLRLTVGVAPLVNVVRYPQIIISGGAEGRAVAYDARLQGGRVNRSSPYVISASEVSRLVGSSYVNTEVQLRHLAVSYRHTWLTREFTGGLAHAWGGITAGWTW